MTDIHIRCLDEVFLPFPKLNARRKCDKRYPEQALQRFISLNKHTLSFLGIDAFIKEKNSTIGLLLKSSKYVGSVPLRSPHDGKYYIDLEVTPRFGENAAEISNLIKQSFEPEYLDLELRENNPLKVPVYIDCINYFNIFFKAIQFAWNKFDTVQKVQTFPCASTNWKKYIETSYDPEKFLSFLNRKNIQSKNHEEWYKLTYIAQYALYLFNSSSTPAVLKFKTKGLTDKISSYLSTHNKITTKNTFLINQLDPIIIRELKQYANKLIINNSKNTQAWRIDSSVLFERYVQYIFKKVAHHIGAQYYSNLRFPISGINKPNWCLRYLEPDIVLSKNGIIFVIDAKYKSHLFNTGNFSYELNNTFREDLHQVLAYSSFNTSPHKMSVIIYPYKEYKEIILTLSAALSQAKNHIVLIGIPLDTKLANKTARNIATLLQNNFAKTSPV